MNKAGWRCVWRTGQQPTDQVTLTTLLCFTGWGLSAVEAPGPRTPVSLTRKWELSCLPPITWEWSMN